MTKAERLDDQDTNNNWIAPERDGEPLACQKVKTTT